MALFNLIKDTRKNHFSAIQLETDITAELASLQQKLDALVYPDAVIYSSRIVHFINDYLEKRIPGEVFTAIKSWEFNENILPYRISAVIDPAMMALKDHIRYVASICMLLNDVAKEILPKDIPLTVKKHPKHYVIEMISNGDADADKIRKCIQILQTRQQAFLNKRNKLN